MCISKVLIDHKHQHMFDNFADCLMKLTGRASVKEFLLLSETTKPLYKKGFIIIYLFREKDNMHVGPTAQRFFPFHR